MQVTTRVLGLSAAAAMLLAVAGLAQNAQPPAGPSPPQTRSGTGIGSAGTTANQFPTPLYRMDNVSKTLNLTPEQINRLNAATERLQTQYSRDFSQLNRLDEKQRLTRMQELMNSYNSDWDKAANGVFNRDQLSRYQQLQLQQGGFTTFMNPTVQQQLNLTQQEIRQLRDEDQRSQQQLRDIEQRARVSPERAQAMYNQFLQDRNSRLSQILTPEQLKQWNTMIGPPFEFAPPFNLQRGK